MRPGVFRAATIALFAIVVGAATPAMAVAQDLGCDREQNQEVKALEFRGNSAIPSSQLALRVKTTPSSLSRRVLKIVGDKRCLNRPELQKDVLNLGRFYRQRGYYDVRVDTLVETAGKDAVRVIFNINEGEPTRLVSYTVTGLQALADSADIMRSLQLQVGQPFDFALFQSDMESILSRLRNQGYYHVIAAPAYDRDTNRVAHASIEVTPGKIARFGEPVFDITAVDIDRGQQLGEPVVRRVLGIPTGQIYSDRAIVDAQRNLFQLGTYRHIEVAPFPDAEQPPGDTIVVLKVRLTEDYMRQVDSEIGWGTLDCGRLRLLYTDKNLLHTARRLELTGQASKLGYGEPLASRATQDACTFGHTSDLKDDPFSLKMHYFVGATLRSPRLLGTRWVPTMALYTERRGEFKAYLRRTQIGADVSVVRDLAERTPFRLAYTAEYGSTEAPDAALCALFNRCDPASRESISRLATLGVASAAVARIRTDNAVSPTRGFAVRSEVRTSASKFLATSDSLYFSKATGDGAWYLPLGRRSVFMTRLRLGAVVGRKLNFTDPVGFIPPQERLYAGGATSVRGFQQNELGSLVYIARHANVDTTIVTATPTDTTWRLHVPEVADSVADPERTVPLGGSSLIVANFEFRLRDPFFFPDLLQYTFFVDGGELWDRGGTDRGLGFSRLKWTPGIGFRASTPVGPVQVNIGYNGYGRPAGAIYYNPNVATLHCVSPGNTIILSRNKGTGPGKGLFEATAADNPNGFPCPSDTYSPPTRQRWYQRLTFTFSIGPDF